MCECVRASVRACVRCVCTRKRKGGDIQTQKYTQEERDGDRDRQTYRVTNTKTYRQIGRLTCMQTDRHTDA